MIEQQQMVVEFHQRFGYPIAQRPRLTPELERERLKLIEEEYGELRRAWEAGDIVKVADALGDLMYVILGTAVACGMDLGLIFEEIHRSNMTKTPGPGSKPEKGPGYWPPRIDVMLRVMESIPLDIELAPDLEGSVHERS